MKSLTKVAAAVLAVMIAQSVGAAVSAERIGAFVTVDGSPDVVVLRGAIDENTSGDLNRVLSAHPKTMIIILDSPGGVVPAALTLATSVHRRGLSTAIPKGASCYSACSYVFFAGREHVAKGSLGVHRIASSVANDSYGIAVQMAAVDAKLTGFGAPAGVFARMTSTPAASMHVFSRGEIAKLSINRVSSTASRTMEIATR